MLSLRFYEPRSGDIFAWFLSRLMSPLRG